MSISISMIFTIYFYSTIKIASSSFSAIISRKVIFHQAFDLSTCAHLLDATAMKYLTNHVFFFSNQLQFH